MTEKATTKQGEKDIMLSVAHIIKHYCDEQTECDGDEAVAAAEHAWNTRVGESNV